MTTSERMLTSRPVPPEIDPAALATAVDAALECAQACTACAVACLQEESATDLAECIRLDLDCADLCAVTARVLSRWSGDGEAHARLVVDACAEICAACGEECAAHGERGMEHCAICAEACRRCERECRVVAATLPA